MFKLAVVLLLCAVVTGTHMSDLFAGCARYRRKPRTLGSRNYARRSALRGVNSSYLQFAHTALKYGGIQPSNGNLKALLRVTRGAMQGFCKIENGSALKPYIQQPRL
ncbi:hypothetical protein MTO96_042045 [Rhipicephalus appendiculatus]